MKAKLLGWLLRVGIAVCVILLVCAGVLLVMEWRPEPIEYTPVTPGPAAPAEPPQAETRLSLLTWNLGYAGLGRQADFFMDGGRQVRPPDRDLVARNLNSMTGWLTSHPAEVVLLQEVDWDSTRTFGMDQVSEIEAALPALLHARAPNFKVRWIPYPLLEPLGRVESGLLSLSRHRPTSALRHQLPGSYSWPVRVFHLKRCLHEIRIPAPDGKDWVVLHLHLSAFDKAGQLRAQQMDYLRRLMQRLHADGHHVIAGGDWNHSFPRVADRQFPSRADIPSWFQRVPAGWTPAGWRWAYDPTTPSLRATDRPYTLGENFLTIVDGFLVGPDVEILSVKTFDLGFEHSDHHPVLLEVALPSKLSPPSSEQTGS